MLRLEQLRLDAGMTRDALAEKSGVSAQTIYRIETRDGFRPRDANLIQLADALGARPSELLRPADAPDAPPPAGAVV